ncbi:MAG: glycosyltransferase [Deltaproteobacteria bacterium]|nr:glycosyltransferase [Deltaproteobacteria bacterium]
MPVPSRLTVVLPAYNEAANLPPLLAQLGAALDGLGRPARVVVVDDGSSDGSGAVAVAHAGALQLEVLRHPTNQGLGSALRDGLAQAIASAADDDIALVMDADDSHPPALIAALVAAIDAGADVAVASRFRRGARLVGIPPLRRLLAQGAALLLAALAPVPGVRDVTGGFRAYRVGALRRAAATRGGSLVDVDGFACMVDLLLALHASGARCVEIPIELRYDRKRGPSKLPVWPTVRDTLRVAWRARR